VADFLSLFGQFAMAISSVGREAFKLWDSLGTGTKQVAGFGAALFAVLTTKFGPFIAGLAAILLLVNDFYTYQQGGKSAFPGMWEWLENMDESLDKSGELGKLRDDLEGVAQQA
jgi:hypothetical protein